MVMIISYGLVCFSSRNFPQPSGLFSLKMIFLPLNIPSLLLLKLRNNLSYSLPVPIFQKSICFRNVTWPLKIKFSKIARERIQKYIYISYLTGRYLTDPYKKHFRQTYFLYFINHQSNFRIAFPQNENARELLLLNLKY